MTGLFPVVPPLQRALRVDQDVRDVLDIGDFPLATADLQQWIVGGARRVGRIDQQYARSWRRKSRTASHADRNSGEMSFGLRDAMACR